MMASDSFDLEVRDNIDVYNLLPATWQAMSPGHKRRDVDIVCDHGSHWNVECINALQTELLIVLKDIPGVQVGMERD